MTKIRAPQGATWELAETDVPRTQAAYVRLPDGGVQTIVWAAPTIICRHYDGRRQPPKKCTICVFASADTASAQAICSCSGLADLPTVTSPGRLSQNQITAVAAEVARQRPIFQNPSMEEW